MLTLNKWYFLTPIILTGVLGIYPFYIPKSEQVLADFGLEDNKFGGLQIIQQTTLLPHPQEIPTVVKTIKVIVTGYSSSVWETDNDPFITASGERVRDGIVANNFLPFGTKIKLPEIFDDKVFIVKDKMHWRKGYYQIDVWFPSSEEALNFGAKLTKMEVLDH